jgi:hypothetical protein
MLLDAATWFLEADIWGSQGHRCFVPGLACVLPHGISANTDPHKPGFAFPGLKVNSLYSDPLCAHLTPTSDYRHQVIFYAHSSLCFV